jgi:2-keto-4-pentenoate hydratase/2-oxohepta-3-ene-1,7-dioic acid hydratase in catechol pathway
MRWVRFSDHDGPRMGRVEEDRVVPLAARRAAELLDEAGRSPAGDARPFEGLRVLAPATPSKIVAVGQNYLDHVREQEVDPPEQPLLFAKFPSSVIGLGEQIRWTDGITEQVDYEAELAVVIGRRAARVSVDEALGHVLGYTCANDVSARDLQFGDGQWTRGKALDRFLPLGPVLVGADEVDDPQDLAIRCRVNGELVQNASTSEMVFSVAQLIAYISEAFTLEPSDVVVTGTPKGVGYFREPQLFLRPGDLVEVEVGDFGRLANPVGEPFPRVSAPLASRELLSRGG